MPGSHRYYKATCFLVVVFVAWPILGQSVPTARPDLQKEYGDALEAIFGMALRLQALLEDPGTSTDRNFLVSPLSAATTIAQLMLGAKGEFAEQLHYLLLLSEVKGDGHRLNIFEEEKNTTYELPHARLHVQLANLLRALRSDGELSPSFTLEEASGLFYDEGGVKLKEGFVHQLDVLYGTLVQPLNFSGDPEEAQDFINDWGSNHTKGLIPVVLADPPSPSTAAILANAVYFKGDWEAPFSDELNMVANFTVRAEKMVPVTFMSGFLEQIAYAEEVDYKLMAMPYKGANLNMYVVLPAEKNPHAYDIRAFVETLKTKHVLETISKAKKHDVIVRIPKLSLSSTLSLLEPLKKFKVYKKEAVTPKTRTNDVVDNLEEKVAAFGNFTAAGAERITEIELDGAAEGVRPLRLSAILQQMTFAVNEKGTEAAAITASVLDYMGGSKSFKVDRPFVFFVRHEPTSAVLFWGAVVDPSLS